MANRRIRAYMVEYEKAGLSIIPKEVSGGIQSEERAPQLYYQKNTFVRKQKNLQRKTQNHPNIILLAGNELIQEHLKNPKKYRQNEEK